MRLGLRGQLVGIASALLVAAVALVGFATAGLMARALEAEAQRNAERVARIAARAFATSIERAGSLDDEALQADLDRLCRVFAQEFEASRLAVVAAPESEAMWLLASYPPGSREAVEGVEILVTRAARESLTRVHDTPDTVRQIEVYAPVDVRGRVVAVVKLELPLAAIGRSVAESQKLILLYLLLDAIVLAVAGTFFLTRLIVRPIRAISEATERVAAGDLDPGLGGVRSKNEIGALAQNFEVMVERLRAARDAADLRVAELEASRAALERARDDLVFSAKMASVGELAAGVAHEIGNPLAAMMGLVELLADREGLSDAEVDDLVARVDREIARIHAIIDGLLGYARVADVAPEVIDIADPVASAVALVAHHPRCRDVRVVIDDGGDGRVYAAVNPVVQVVLNLLLNAADAMDGSGEVRIDWTRARSESGDGVLLRVADGGPGIASTIADQIFEPFVTTKGSSGGTGLGLSVSARIVTRYGGKIWVGSAESGGAVFHVWLPSPPADPISGGGDA